MEQREQGEISPSSNRPESRRRGLAWIVLAFSTLLSIAYFLLLFSGNEIDGRDVAFNLLTLAFLGVGTLLSLKEPHNLVGWSLSMFALTGFFAMAAMEYGRFAIRSGLPFAGLAGALDGAVGDWLSPIFFVGTFLFFPNGRLPSPRWRWYLYGVILAQGVGFLATLLRPGIGLRVSARNPIGVPGAFDICNAIRDAASVVLIPLTIFLFVSLFVRRRRASVIERQQLRWLFFTASLIALIFVVIAAIEITGSEWGDSYGEFVWFGLLTLMLASIAVAVLKYRLYDIDVIINRALVYAGLSGILALAYVTIVFGLQRVLSPVTYESDLAIAASTLAVAGLFRPVRSRVQGLIDKRFYRRKFDVRQTLETFSASARNEVELGALSNQLVGVIRETMEPAHVSLWLRGP